MDWITLAAEQKCTVH